MNPAYGSWEAGTRMRPAGAHRSGLYAFRPGTEHRSRTYLLEEPIGSLGFPIHPAITACIEVWRGVIENAIRDALGGQPRSKSREYELRRTNEILTAREWIWSREFDDICELALFHPGPFRRALADLPEVVRPAPLPVKEKKRRGPKPWVLMTPQEQARAEDAYERKRRKEIKAAERELREREKKQAQHQREVLELYDRMEEVRRLEARQSERAEAWRRKYQQHMAQFQEN